MLVEAPAMSVEAGWFHDFETTYERLLREMSAKKGKAAAKAKLKTERSFTGRSWPSTRGKGRAATHSKSPRWCAS